MQYWVFMHTQDGRQEGRAVDHGSIRDMLLLHQDNILPKSRGMCTSESIFVFEVRPVHGFSNYTCLETVKIFTVQPKVRQSYTVNDR